MILKVKWTFTHQVLALTNGRSVICLSLVFIFAVCVTCIAAQLPLKALAVLGASEPRQHSGVLRPFGGMLGQLAEVLDTSAHT
jgi:hypothetical protein